MKPEIMARWLVVLVCASAPGLKADEYDQDATNLQAAFGRFPLLTPVTNDVGEPAFQTIDLTNGFYSNGKIFYGFRFQCQRGEKSEDFLWSFVDPGVFFHWYILPQSGEMSGFTDYDSRSKADYMGPDPLFPLRGRTLYVQRLSGDSLQDDGTYLIWFHFAQKPLPKLSVAFTFGKQPEDTNQGRAIGKVLGLMHRESRPVVNPANHHTYILLRRNNWQRSEEHAVALGGHLATVRNQAEEDWIARTFGNYGGEPRLLWIGLSDTAEKSHLSWSSGESVSYTDWAPGAPANSGQGTNYIAISNPGDAQGGKWKDWHDQTESAARVPMNGVAEIIPTGSAQNAEAGSFVPEIIKIDGMARLSTNGFQTSRYAQVGDSVGSGTALQTSDTTTVEISLNQNTADETVDISAVAVPKREKNDHLLLLGESVLVFTQVSYKGTLALETLMLDLRAGVLTAAVSQLPPKSRFQIRLADGVVSIEGATRCSVDASGTIILNEGSVTFTGKLADGKSITKRLNSNQKFDIRSGQTSKI